MQVKSMSSGKLHTGNVEVYGLGEHISMYVCRGAGQATLGGTVAFVKMNRTEARELMAQLAKVVEQ